MFRHFDLYAQALSKIERGHAQDEGDVREMFDRGLVDRVKLLEYFSAIEPRLYRYPAIDPARSGEPWSGRPTPRAGSSDPADLSVHALDHPDGPPPNGIAKMPRSPSA